MAECECTGHNTGIAYVTCVKCDTKNSPLADYDLAEDDEGEEEVLTEQDINSDDFEDEIDAQFDE